MYCGECTVLLSEWNFNKMTKGKRKKRGVKDKPPEIMNNKSDGMIMKHMGVKEKPPEIDIIRNSTDVIELKDVKRKPPDFVVCEPYCGKCQKVKPHIDTLRKYADRFVDTVLAERKSLG